MTLTIEQTDAAILETLYNMEEGVDYMLNDFWFQETNQIRKEWGYSLMKNKQEYKFSRKGDKLFVNNSFLLDFAGKNNLTLPLAFALSLPFGLGAAAVALMHNGIEKLTKDTCEGRVVEIDGRKYKLTLV